MCGCNNQKTPKLKQQRMPNSKMTTKLPKPTVRPGGKKIPKV